MDDAMEPGALDEAPDAAPEGVAPFDVEELALLDDGKFRPTLFAHAATVDLRNGRTALHWACACGMPCWCCVLIQAGSDANKADFVGNTPLHEAARAGNASCVSALIKAGSAVGARTRYGSTALHEAAGNGHVACVRELLKAGGDANLGNLTRGLTPLHGAAVCGHADCVEALLRGGGDPNRPDLAPLLLRD